MYKDVDKKESIRGIKFWTNPENKFNILMLNYTADPSKDPERDGKEWYEKEREGMPKLKWEKEYEISFTTKSGMLVYGPEFCDFSKDVHLINSFDLGQTENMLGLDFGQRNPNAALVAAVDMSGAMYIIDEYYKPAIPSVASREMFEKFSYLMPEYRSSMSMEEKRVVADSTFQIKVIDPTTGHKNRTKIIEGEEIPYSVIEDFYDNGWDFQRGQNNFEAGVTKVRELFGIKNGKAGLYIFADKCLNLVEEILNYSYKENTSRTARELNVSERPRKINDHGMDCLRYLVMERPNLPVLAEKALTPIQRDIRNLTKPKFFNDFDIT